jgi:hypothetical protein
MSQFFDPPNFELYEDSCYEKVPQQQHIKNSLTRLSQKNQFLVEKSDDSMASMVPESL